jgi:hypothetical protein
VQIVGYETAADGDAALVVADDGRIRRESLAPDTELSYSLGARHCAGAVEGDSHQPCAAERAPFCERHTSRWACARCTGDCERPLAACREEHAIYLAAFAPETFKVGVTRSWRLETRLREQGADRGAHLQTVADGRTARQREADIATSVGDRVRVPTKVDGLGDEVDDGAWQALLASYDPVTVFEFEYGLSLTERPVSETLVSGVVRGTKGRVLVLDRGGTTYAVDLRSLVGHELAEGRSERRLQSSFTAFE